ncbi:MAG TPA: dockerin type I domain-containing protein [Anaerolineae bacterium]
MSRHVRLMFVAGLAAALALSGTVSAQSPSTYTSIVVTDITSGAPVVGGIFTTHVNVSVSNNGSTPVAVQGVEAYIGFDPNVVNVVDFDSNPVNGVQVEVRTGFFTTIQTGINRVETPCPAPSVKPACVHFAVSQTTGGVTNGSGLVAVIRWVGVAAGSAGVSVEVPPTALSDPNGMSVLINNASASSITVMSPGAIMGGVTRQGRPAGGHAGTTVTAMSSGTGVTGAATTLGDGTFASPLAVPTGGTYTVIASYPGYLSAQKSNVYVVGSTVDIGATQLRGGDVNSDNCINIFDLVTVATWFSQASPPAPAVVDINDDGVINIFDLTITASNFSRCGPTTW